MAESKCLVGIDVGGTKIYGGIVRSSGAILETYKMATPLGATAKEVVALICKTVRTLCAEVDVPVKSLAGIGVAIPGIVDNDGRVVVTPNLELGNVGLVQVLQKLLKVKVAVGNDVNLGVLGERWLGAARKAKNVIGIFPGTGVGGGILINGEFVSGSQGAAGEIGHMIIDPNGPKCSCGNIGCLEAHTGRWAIERDIQLALRKGESSVLTKLLGKEFLPIKSGTLAKALKAKDPLVTRTMDKVARTLGQACVSLNHIFDPDMFLFGGGVVEACEDFLLPRIAQEIKKDPFFKGLRTPLVTAAKLGDEAVLLGAVAMAMKKVGMRSAGPSEYYPAIRFARGSLKIKNKAVKKSCLVRADGKLRVFVEPLPTVLGPEFLAPALKKGPDLLVVATTATYKMSVTAKGKSFLKKKGIALKILPMSRAVKAFTASHERRAIILPV